MLEIAAMTLAQIKTALTPDNITADLIAALTSDRRSAVQKLGERCQKDQQRRQAEEARLYGMYEQERLLAQAGHRLIAGVDEAGRGPLAGPLVVGAAILPLHCQLPLLNDSKKLSARQRQHLYEEIKAAALAVAYVVIEPDEIDRLNIYQATISGMYQSLAQLTLKPDAALIDAVPLPELNVPSLSLIGGDAISASIAAASIIAKVERDRIMLELDEHYPQYGFAKHKGYGTAEHVNAILQYGPCPVHRQSFEPVKSWNGASV